MLDFLTVNNKQMNRHCEFACQLRVIFLPCPKYQVRGFMKTFLKLVLTVFLIIISANPVFSQDATKETPAPEAKEPAAPAAKETPAPASPAVKSPSENMKSSIDDYYSSKRTTSYFYLGMGAYSVLYPVIPKNNYIPSGNSSWALEGNDPMKKPFEYRTNSNLYTQGFSTVMFGFGAYELFEGYNLFTTYKSDKANAAKQSFDTDPRDFKQKESDRLFGSNQYDDRGSEQARIRNKRVFLVSTAAVGLLGAYYAQTKTPTGTALDKLIGHEKNESYIKGFSHALILQSVFVLGIDFLIGEKSSTLYIDALRNLQFSYIPASQNRDAFTGLRESYSGISTTIRF